MNIEAQKKIQYSCKKKECSLVVYANKKKISCNGEL